MRWGAVRGQRKICVPESGIKVSFFFLRKSFLSAGISPAPHPPPPPSGSLSNGLSRRSLSKLLAQGFPPRVRCFLKASCASCILLRVYPVTPLRREKGKENC